MDLKLKTMTGYQTKHKNDTIQLHILNRSFTRTIEIRKNQVIMFLFLLGQKSTYKINTKYTIFS